MTPKIHFSTLDEKTVLGLVGLMRCQDATERERLGAEIDLFDCIFPIGLCLSRLRFPTFAYDHEQVAVDSIAQFVRIYVADKLFRFHSIGHFVSLLDVIAKNNKRMAYRKCRSVRRTPRDADGQSLPVVSLIDDNDFRDNNSDDPGCVCEFDDTKKTCLNLLEESSLQQLFELRILGFTQQEIATQMGVDINLVRRLTRRMREKLQPPATRLQPQATSHKPQDSRLKTQDSRLKTQDSRLKTQD